MSQMGGGENDGKTTPGFFSALTSFGSNFLKARKPWSELYDYRSISTPHGIWDYTSRLRKNSVYFGVNYVIFLFSIMIGIVAFRPTSLGILVALTMLWVYMLIFRKADLTIGGTTLTLRLQTILLAMFSFLVIFYLTNVGAVLSAGISTGMLIICVHGGLRTPQVDIVAENEGTNNFFGNFLEKNFSENMSFDTVRSTFSLPDNPFTRRLERTADTLMAKVEGNMKL